MRSNTILKVVLASSLLLSASAFAQDSDKTYVRVDAGFSMLAKNPNKEDYTKKPKGSPVYGIGFGYKFTDHIRSDFTITQRSNFKYSGKNISDEQESQKIRSTAFMLNGYYDIADYNGFVPYLMAGAGMAYNKAGDFKQDTDTTKGKLKSSFAWQAGLGTQYKISKSVNLDLGYRYVSLGKISTTREFSGSIGDAVTGKLRSHEILCGVSYSF